MTFSTSLNPTPDSGSRESGPSVPVDPQIVESPQDTDAVQPVQGSSPGTGRFAQLGVLAGTGFIPLGLFARLPLAMLTVGTLTLATSVTSSYALGGAAAGAVGIGSALGAPLLGALADRKGQRTVLLTAAILNTVAVVVLILVAYGLTPESSYTSALPVLVAALVAGATCPQVGPLARVRWMALTSARPGPHGSARDLDTALSYESTADELTFVMGPALVGILASLVAPWLPLAIAAALTITLVPLFAVHPTERAVPKRRKVEIPPNEASGNPSAGHGAAADSTVTPRRRPAATVVLPVLAMVFMGTFFGGTQTALSSFAAGFATSDIAGLLYSVMGLSSAAAALSVAYWPASVAVRLRWPLCAAVMAGLSLLLLLPTGAGSMVLTLFILGLPVGPVMVTVFAIGGKLAPSGSLGTVMTALASGIVAGTALGAAVAGQLAQQLDSTAAFLVPVGAATGLFLLGCATALVLKDRDKTV